jgi:hypothetical protein
VNYGIAQVRKAIAAAVIAAAGVIVTASQKGSVGTPDYIAAAVAALIAGVGVFLIPNAPVAVSVPKP